jgi:DNA-binding transcriptional MerR regulator
MLMVFHGPEDGASRRLEVKWGMSLVSIGEAARRLGLNASALRYYEERGLVQPTSRRSGRRLYGPEALRRLAFIQLGQRLGLGLDVAGAVLEKPSPAWRQVVRAEIATLEQLIAQARTAQELLAHVLTCPAEHPTRECPVMIALLDRRVAGATFEELEAEHRAEHGDGDRGRPRRTVPRVAPDGGKGKSHRQRRSRS